MVQKVVTTANPMEIRVPMRSRLRMSRPKGSVPKRCAAPGACKTSSILI